MNNIFLTTKQTKAIKVLIDNLDSDNEAIQRMRYGLKTTDTGDMTLAEAQSIVDRMKPEKKNAVNDILSGKVQTINQHKKEVSKKSGSFLRNILTIILFVIMVIGLIYGFGIITNITLIFIALVITGRLWFCFQKKKRSNLH